ncbi:hypothetical protein K502DRAFT_322482, partial [Neoconidiobolus thromboides FSU 785]
MERKVEVEKLLSSMKEITLKIQDMHKLNFPDQSPSKYIKHSLIKNHILIDKLVDLLKDFQGKYLFHSDNYVKKIHHHNGLLAYARSLLNSFYALDKVKRKTEFLKYKIKMFELEANFNTSFEDLLNVPIAQQPVLKSKKNHIRSRTMGDFSYTMMNLSQDRKFTFMPNQANRPPSIRQEDPNTSIKSTNQDLIKTSYHIPEADNSLDKRSSLPALCSSLSLTQSTVQDTASVLSFSSVDSNDEQLLPFQHKVQQLDPRAGKNNLETISNKNIS